MSQTYGFVIRFENLLRKSEIPGIRKGVYAGKDSESVRLKIGNGIGWITEAGDNIRLFGIPVNTFFKAVNSSLSTTNKLIHHQKWSKVVVLGSKSLKCKVSSLFSTLNHGSERKHRQNGTSSDVLFGCLCL